MAAGSWGSSIVWDGKLAAYLLDASASKYNLSELIIRYRADAAFTCEAWPDAGALADLFAKMKAEITALGEDALYNDIEFPLAQVLADMTRIGILVDREGIEKFGVKMRAELEDVLTRIHMETGSASFNPNSPKQLGEMLFDTMGLPHGKKTQRGWSTDAETLESLRDYPLVEDILQYRAYQKLNSTYVEGLLKVIGEDGRIQATLDLLGVPYTGAGYLGSAIAMDKIAAKEMMDANGIPNPKWQKLTYTEEEIPQLAETLPMPCVVKAPTGGSSLGVYLPKDRAELADALRQVRSFCHEVLVEQRIYGRELTDAVLGERYLPPVETFPSVENFDYEAKYQAGGAKEICPAELTEEQAKAVGEMALRVHKALGLAVYSRTDMIMDENGQLWCLEANSLPGMTPTSFVPKEAAAVGISYDDLCEEIVRQSLKIKRR